MPASFTTEDFQFPISEKAGAVSAILIRPELPKAVVTIAHSAGSDMHQPFLRELCEAFAEHNVATMRFNFPYRENGKKMPDRQPVATATIQAAIDQAVMRVPGVPVFCAGKSFGGRMSSLALSEHPRAEVKGLIFYGFPLHPADEPSVERARHLEKCRVPMLFLQGTRDKLAYVDLITAECAKLPLATLVKLEGADHSLARGKQSGIPAIVQRSAHWLYQIATPAFGDSAGHLTASPPN